MNLDTFVPEPSVRGLSSHGGYCGPAVKPIALNMVQPCAADPEVRLPISGIGGITTWRDAAEFIALGSTSSKSAPPSCTTAFASPRPDRRTECLSRRKGLKCLEDLRGRAVEPSEDGKARPQLAAHRRDRLRQVHRLQPLLHRLRGRRPPGDRAGRSGLLRARTRSRARQASP